MERNMCVLFVLLGIKENSFRILHRQRDLCARGAGDSSSLIVRAKSAPRPRSRGRDSCLSWLSDSYMPPIYIREAREGL